LAAKFGKEFMMQALENEDERVDPKVRMMIVLHVSVYLCFDMFRLL
jgi:hypothetical protein